MSGDKPIPAKDSNAADPDNAPLIFSIEVSTLPGIIGLPVFVRRLLKWR
jgi:hypothetical protein